MPIDPVLFDLITSSVLNQDSYEIISKESYKHFNINDRIVCFFDGKHWNTVLLDDMLAHPLLYFDFWLERENVSYVNTLLVCPITMRAMIYKGRIKIIDIVDDNLKLYNTDTDDTFIMDMPYTGHVYKNGKPKRIKSHIKRYDVKMTTLKDAYSFLIDMLYIVPKKSFKHRPILGDHYYQNRLTYDKKEISTAIHPKTIVYVIQYYSFSMNRYVYTIIVGKDSNKNNVTGYGYKTSGIFDHISRHKEEYLKKRAYIYPVFWFIVEKMYPTATIRVASTD
jgi:hypothetical protein